MKSTEKARQFLEHLSRYDLSQLLAHSKYIVETQEDDWGFGDIKKSLVICSPRPFSDALEILPEHDLKRVIEAIGSGDTDISSGRINPSNYLSLPLDHIEIQGVAALLPELILNKELMIAVATRNKPIQEVNDYYIARHSRIREAATSINLEYLNPHDDLWAWYRHWKEHFSSYAERRNYVNGLFKNPISTVSTRPASGSAPRDPTGWERVDRGLTKARNQLDMAKNEEDFQTIGLICREVIISLAQAVYDAKLHNSLDGITPSSTDASRMLEAYIHYVVAGDSFKEVRAHAKASLNLALNLQHRRTATMQLAQLCLEATSSTTSVIAIIAERR